MPEPIRGSFADQVERDLALRRVVAMFEKENALPGTEGKLSVSDRNSQLRLRQGRSQMGRHVVGSFLSMLVWSVLGRDSGEIGFEVAPRGGGCIFLDHQRSRGVAAE